ncbi:hypothetical protein HMPREF9968_0436 [Streptococcus oralis SK255]|uniref:Uncharacterized protein n=1 Tax=Streptococcus oralis SK255 TaxID=1005704 RepID=F5VS13_STROR|nr:hypothetical protein HMPREF9968_0436 [Streptococcus oralis SK255]
MLNYLYILPFFPSFGNNEHATNKKKISEYLEKFFKERNFTKQLLFP